MFPTTIGKIHQKWNSCFVPKMRIIFLKWRGMRIQPKSNIGKITCEWPNKIVIGANCEIQNNVDFKVWQPFNENSEIIIGNDCLIASKTTFVDTGHYFLKENKINKQECTSGEIKLEEDVWVGTSCVILQGVTIGKGAVIGSGSVVNKSIPAYEVWAGVPARFIKKRI